MLFQCNIRSVLFLPAMQMTKGKVAEGLCVEGAMPVSEAGGSLFGAR